MAHERPVRATIAHVHDGDVRDEVADGLLAAGSDADWLATFVTLHAENTFPALPIREDADVVVVLTAGSTSTPATNSCGSSRRNGRRIR